MSSDLKIIKQLEREIWQPSVFNSLFGKKLKKSTEINYDSVGYTINSQQQVIELSLYECEIKQIPECLSTLIYLKELYLVDNKIEQLPDSFGQLQNLSELDLSDTQLKELPTSFGQLQNLSYLRLEENQLKELPASFRKLKKMRTSYI